MTPPPRLVPDRPSDWLSDLHDHMTHCVSAADEGEDYAVSRPMLDAMTALGLMAKVGRGKWAPTDEGRRFAEARRASTLPIDIRGEWYEVPIPVHLHVIALRDAAAPPAEAPAERGTTENERIAAWLELLADAPDTGAPLTVGEKHNLRLAARKLRPLAAAPAAPAEGDGRTVLVPRKEGPALPVMGRLVDDGSTFGRIESAPRVTDTAAPAEGVSRADAEVMVDGIIETAWLEGSEHRKAWGQRLMDLRNELVRTLTAPRVTGGREDLAELLQAIQDNRGLNVIREIAARLQSANGGEGCNG